MAPPLAANLVAFRTFLTITRQVSSESKYSSSLKTTLVSESSSSSPGGEIDVDLKEEIKEVAVDYNHIKGLPNQTSNRVTYAGRTDSRIILIRRANSRRSST